MGGGGDGGGAMKDIMSGTVAGFAQVAVGEKESRRKSNCTHPSHVLCGLEGKGRGRRGCSCCENTRVERKEVDSIVVASKVHG